jgi:excisionase family DNA binding protein
MNVLTISEAAQVMRCSKAHVLNVIHGRVTNVPPLPCVRIGRRILIRREALEFWLAAVETTALVSA